MGKTYDITVRHFCDGCTREDGYNKTVGPDFDLAVRLVSSLPTGWVEDGGLFCDLCALDP